MVFEVFDFVTPKAQIDEASEEIFFDSIYDKELCEQEVDQNNDEQMVINLEVEAREQKEEERKTQFSRRKKDETQT